MPIGNKEGVVLFRGESGQRLEPVGVVGRAALHGPLFHRGRHNVGQGRVEPLAMVDGALEAFEDLLREPLLHDLFGEDIRRKGLVDAVVAAAGHEVLQARGGVG